MVAVAAAAIVTIVLAARLGREMLSDDSPAKSAAPAVVRFHETGADFWLSYPVTWTRVQSPDPEVPLLVVAPDRSLALQVRRSATGLEQITRDTLAIPKPLTDRLVRAIKRAKLVKPAQPVELGGLIGWRYRYTLGADERARDHYFLFKPARRGLLVALVFEARSAARLNAAAPQIERITRSLRDGGP